MGGGHLAGFAAHQAAPTWRSPDQKRPAEAALPQRAAARAVRPKRSASSAAAAQPPAAASRMHTSQGGPGTLPTSPSAAMLHGCSLAELAPLKQDSALLMSGSVPVPAAPTPRAARAPLSGSGGSGRATPVDDSGSACSSPRASLRCDAAQLALCQHGCGLGIVACTCQLAVFGPDSSPAPIGARAKVREQAGPQLQAQLAQYPAPPRCSSDPARLAAIAARVAELLAGMPAEQSAELLSVRSFLSQF